MCRYFDQLVWQCEPDHTESVAGGPVIAEVLLVESCEFGEVLTNVDDEDIGFDDVVTLGAKMGENSVQVLEGHAGLSDEVTGVQEVPVQVV
jgi:hypothetical protein